MLPKPMPPADAPDHGRYVAAMACAANPAAQRFRTDLVTVEGRTYGGEPTGPPHVWKPHGRISGTTPQALSCVPSHLSAATGTVAAKEVCGVY